MTDRVKGLVVTLDRDYRTDDVEIIINAIRMIKGVVGVEHSIADMDDHLNRERIRTELITQIYDVLKR